MSKRIKVISILVGLFIVFSVLGFGAHNVQAATCTKYHTVKSGEWLAKIARNYGVSWKYLAEINNLSNPSKIYPGQKLCISMDTSSAPPSGQTGQLPIFFISAVQRDVNVTITTSYFQANAVYQVRMGPYGTQGVNGIKVSQWNSGSGGTQSPVFNIPDQLKGSSKIAIRLEALSGAKNYAYNWFYNNTTSGGSSGTGGAAPIPGYSGIPTFSISAVVRNSSVTITTKNFPPNLAFDVLMGPMGSRGINGVKVGTLNSATGGSITASYSIPAQFSGSYQIAIRTQNYSNGYYAYNWFYNNSTK